MVPAEVYSGRFLFDELEHAIYKFVANLEPGLILDVGAAAGYYSAFMVQLSPKSKVLAFEPFPGNWPHFEKRVGDNPSIVLRKEAVAGETGSVKFYVASTVQGSEAGWSTMQGYSSIGRIVAKNHPKVGEAIEVPAVRLDDVVHEHVRFCKMDVQGGELAVLRGADRLIKEHGVDVFYIEFGGEVEILKLLSERGYVLFDSEYLLVIRKQKPVSEKWNITGPVKLSTGDEAYYAWPKDIPRSIGNYCAWIKEQTGLLGGVFSDVVAVHQSFLPEFLSSAGRAMAQKSSQAPGAI